MAPSPAGEPARRSAPLRLAFATLLLAHGAGAGPDTADPELAFSRHGEPVATHDLDWLVGVAAPRPVTVLEPYEDRDVTFEALPLDRVLDAVYTPSWRKEEELLLTCRDGYEPTLPVERVLSHRAWLAFARPGADGFAIEKRESGKVQRIDLAPFYLVWENRDDVQVREEGDYGWPYQLVGIDLIRTRDRFPKLVPPPGASEEVQAGFAAFRVHCSKCHRLNGEGGSIGPELGGAASPLAYRDSDWLRAWIEEPSRILPGARMPPLNPALPDRARVVDEILAYLRAMRQSRGDADAP